MYQKRLSRFVFVLGLLGSGAACLGESTSGREQPVESKGVDSSHSPTGQLGAPEQDPKITHAGSGVGVSPWAVIGSILGVSTLGGVGAFAFVNRDIIRDEGFFPTASKALSHTRMKAEKAMLQKLTSLHVDVMDKLDDPGTVHTVLMFRLREKEVFEAVQSVDDDHLAEVAQLRLRAKHMFDAARGVSAELLIEVARTYAGKDTWKLTSQLYVKNKLPILLDIRKDRLLKKAFDAATKIDRQFVKKIIQDPRFVLGLKNPEDYDLFHALYQDIDNPNILKGKIGNINNLKPYLKQMAYERRLKALLDDVGWQEYWISRFGDKTFYRNVAGNNNNIKDVVSRTIPELSKVVLTVGDTFTGALTAWNGDQGSAEKLAKVIQFIVRDGALGTLGVIQVDGKPFDIWRVLSNQFQTIFITLYCLEQIGAIPMLP